MRDDYENREMRQILDHVEMDTLGALAPALQRLFRGLAKIRRQDNTVLHHHRGDIWNPKDGCQSCR